MGKEIHDYPPPIPACDADFNSMLEERARISDELGRFAGLDSAPLTARDYADRIDRFAVSSLCVDQGTRQEIRALLKKALAKLE